jgi:hypothetical protein
LLILFDSAKGNVIKRARKRRKEEEEERGRA